MIEIDTVSEMRDFTPEELREAIEASLRRASEEPPEAPVGGTPTATFLRLSSCRRGTR